MFTQMKIYLEEADELNDLRDWMSGHSGIVVEMVPCPAAPNAQGSVWDFLSVLCASAGPVVAAVRALQLWIESRVTVIEISVGDERFVVRTTDAATVLPQVEKIATKMLESGDARTDEAS